MTLPTRAALMTIGLCALASASCSTSRTGFASTWNHSARLSSAAVALQRPDDVGPLAQAPQISLTPPRAPAPPLVVRAVSIPHAACRPAPDFPASVLAKLTPDELAILTTRAEINSKARHAIRAACRHAGTIVRVERGS